MDPMSPKRWPAVAANALLDPNECSPNGLLQSLTSQEGRFNQLEGSAGLNQRKVLIACVFSNHVGLNHRKFSVGKPVWMRDAVRP